MLNRYLLPALETRRGHVCGADDVSSFRLAPVAFVNGGGGRKPPEIDRRERAIDLLPLYARPRPSHVRARFAWETERSFRGRPCPPLGFIINLKYRPRASVCVSVVPVCTARLFVHENRVWKGLSKNEGVNGTNQHKHGTNEGPRSQLDILNGRGQRVSGTAQTNLRIVKKGIEHKRKRYTAQT